MLCIPPNPTTEGQLEVVLDLSTEEWQGITSRLKDVLAHLKAQNECASQSYWLTVNADQLSGDGLIDRGSGHVKALAFFRRYLDNQGLGNDTALEQQDPPLDDQTAEQHLPALDGSTYQGAVSAETPVQDAIFQHSLSPEPGHAEQQQALPGSDLPGALQAMLGSSVPQISQQASHAHAEVCSHASHCNGSQVLSSRQLCTVLSLMFRIYHADTLCHAIHS